MTKDRQYSESESARNCEDAILASTEAERAVAGDPELLEVGFQLSHTEAGMRLDQTLAGRLSDFSRSRIQTWIEQGAVLVDDETGRAKQRMRGTERLRLCVELEPLGRCDPEPIPLNLIYEDADLLVINKPAGLVVHPGAGNPRGTLQNGLLHLDPRLEQLPRCGIVHRLDKDTSGLMVVARSSGAHRALVEQLQARSVKRIYRALVDGQTPPEGRVDAPIGRHPRQRTRMAVVTDGRPAISEYRRLAQASGCSLVSVRLQTGRTHQIRVHLTHIGYPLVGDPVYGGRARLPAGLDERQREALQAFPRQALHAKELGFRHPATDELMQFVVPMAADMAELLRQLGLPDD